MVWRPPGEGRNWLCCPSCVVLWRLLPWAGEGLGECPPTHPCAHATCLLSTCSLLGSPEDQPEPPALASQLAAR